MNHLRVFWLTCTKRRPKSSAVAAASRIIRSRRPRLRGLLGSVMGSVDMQRYQADCSRLKPLPTAPLQLPLFLPMLTGYEHLREPGDGASPRGMASPDLRRSRSLTPVCPADDTDASVGICSVFG